MKSVEIFEEVAVAVEYGTMGFVGNDEVEKSDIEVLELLDHGRVGANIDLLVAIFVGITADDYAGFAGKMFLEGFVALFYKFATVA